MKNWTFGKRLTVAFATCGLALVIVAVSGYRTTTQLIGNERWVVHTHDVRSRIALLLALFSEAESGQRAFLLTGDENYLLPYREALPRIERVFEELRTLTVDNPDQQRQLNALRPALDSRLAYLAQLIQMKRSAPNNLAGLQAAIGDGAQIMQDIRTRIGAMDADESRLLALRNAEAISNAEGAVTVIVWGSGIALLFTLIAAVVVSRGLSKQVGLAVRHIQSSSTELQAAATQQASGASEQATAMNEVTTTISELMASSRQIAESAERVVRIAEQTADSARAGDSRVERSNESVTSIRHQVDLIVNHMLELGRKSQQIGAVLEIVSELAEQTNILAINATIEAAGAGESGGRFGVVADEIRKLADRVSSSAKQIRGMIDDIRGAVNTTVMTTETGSKAVDSGAQQFADVASAFRDIARNVLTSAEAAKEIGLATKQQATAVEQVNVAISSVALAVRESEVSTRQTLQTAAELASLSKDLMRIVQPEQQRYAHAA